MHYEKEYKSIILKEIEWTIQMFAVNDIAAIRPGEREHMVESIKKRIQTAAFSKLSETYGSESGKYEAIKAKIEEYPFFLISASDALNARTDRDDELLAESGIQKLEDALAYMLEAKYGAVKI